MIQLWGYITGSTEALLAYVIESTFYCFVIFYYFHIIYNLMKKLHWYEFERNKKPMKQFIVIIILCDLFAILLTIMLIYTPYQSDLNEIYDECMDD